MDRMKIAAIFADQEQLGGKEITVCGWARTIRDMKTFGFIELNDGSCFRNLQVVMSADELHNYKEIAGQNVGADLMVGSLIKNPGGGLAPTGGYICGRADLIERCARRLTAPGLGREVGANLGLLTQFYQGFFLAPTVVASAVKGAVFAANCYEKLGFHVIPGASEVRHDIIQAVTFGKPEGVIAFCQGIQAAAPVDSFVTPEPWDMPGYDSQVIMAAGAFTNGASIELSADAPLREPYAVWMQGGLTYQTGKVGIMLAAQSMLEKGIIHLS